MSWRNQSVVVFCIVVCSGVGCAFVQRHPMLSYDAALSPASPNGAAVTVGDFADQRTWSRDKIGDIRNGFGMKCADIVPRNSVTDWIREAFIKELSNAGYTISDADSTTPVINGIVLDVYTNSLVNFVGRVRLKVILTKDGQEVLNKEYFYENINNDAASLFNTEESYAEMMKMTLQYLMKTIVPELNQKLLAK
ncbi:MAG: YajG family lipoprotein [Planctomycetota bacterium]|nr:YajG family lipoprotein [Planctomycetota bacterium]